MKHFHFLHTIVTVIFLLIPFPDKSENISCLSHNTWILISVISPASTVQHGIQFVVNWINGSTNLPIMLGRIQPILTHGLPIFLDGNHF